MPVSSAEQPLFQPLVVAGLELQNRIVMSPMTRGRSPDGVPGQLNAAYYSMRADAGLIFAESTAISPYGRGYHHNPCIYTDEHVAGWRTVTDAVHERGGKIFLQLWHTGHNSHPTLQPNGETPIGPSAVPVHGIARTPNGPMPLITPRAVELSEFPALIDEYRQAALRAKSAGFDGVEVHAGNGYLLDQFLRDGTNKRTDIYGGSPENRRRLLLEVVEAVAEHWDLSRISVRISPVNPAQFEIYDSRPEETYACAVEGLEALRIGFLHVVEGSTKPMLPGTTVPDVEQPFDFGLLRRRFTGTYIANNRHSFESGNEAIRSGHADLVSFGRPFLANPDLVTRFRLGAPLNDVNRATMYERDGTGYLDYPTLAAAPA